MGKTTDIGWTHWPGYVGGTWNPWQGCVKKSPGCDHCYMYREKLFYGSRPDVVVRSMPPTFNMPLKVKEPTVFFTCSWSDWFNPEADPWREEAWDIVRRTRDRHVFLILTKLAQRIERCLPLDWGAGWPNVALGVSAEDQQWADIRLPRLLKVPAWLHFVSAEPLIGGINLTPYLWPGASELQPDDPRFADMQSDVRAMRSVGSRLGWVITGGESGPGHRPMRFDWVRSIRDECHHFDVPFFHKQHGGSRKINGTWGGRELDGQTYDGLPERL